MKILQWPTRLLFLICLPFMMLAIGIYYACRHIENAAHFWRLDMCQELETVKHIWKNPNKGEMI